MFCCFCQYRRLCEWYRLNSVFAPFYRYLDTQLNYIQAYMFLNPWPTLCRAQYKRWVTQNERSRFFRQLNHFHPCLIFRHSNMCLGKSQKIKKTTGLWEKLNLVNTNDCVIVDYEEADELRIQVL